MSSSGSLTFSIQKSLGSEDEEEIRDGLNKIKDNMNVLKKGSIIRALATMVTDTARDVSMDLRREALRTCIDFVEDEKGENATKFLKSISQKGSRAAMIFVSYLDQAEDDDMNDDDMNDDVWSCMERLVTVACDCSSPKVKAQQVKALMIEGDFCRQSLNVLLGSEESTKCTDAATTILRTFCLRTGEKMFKDYVKSILGFLKGVSILLDILEVTPETYADVIARFCNLPSGRAGLCESNGIDVCANILKKQKTALGVTEMRAICKILQSLMCDTTLDDISVPILDASRAVQDPHLDVLEVLCEIMKSVVTNAEIDSESSFDVELFNIICSTLMRLCQRKPCTYQLKVDEDDDDVVEYDRIGAMKNRMRDVSALHTLLRALQSSGLNAATLNRIERAATFLISHDNDEGEEGNVDNAIALDVESLCLILSGFSSEHTIRPMGRLLRLTLRNAQNKVKLLDNRAVPSLLSVVQTISSSVPSSSAQWRDLNLLLSSIDILCRSVTTDVGKMGFGDASETSKSVECLIGLMRECIVNNKSSNMMEKCVVSCTSILSAALSHEIAHRHGGACLVWDEVRRRMSDMFHLIVGITGETAYLNDVLKLHEKLLATPGTLGVLTQHLSDATRSKEEKDASNDVNTDCHVLDKIVDTYVTLLSRDGGNIQEASTAAAILNVLVTKRDDTRVEERFIRAVARRGALGEVISLLENHESDSQSVRTFSNTIIFYAVSLNAEDAKKEDESPLDEENDAATEDDIDQGHDKSSTTCEEDTTSTVAVNEETTKRAMISVEEWAVHLNAPCRAGRYRSYSPLHVAVTIGCNDVVGMLVRARASMKSVDQSGFTPIMRALACGNVEAVELMLSVLSNETIPRNYRAQAMKTVDMSPATDEMMPLKLALVVPSAKDIQTQASHYLPEQVATRAREEFETMLASKRTRGNNKIVRSISSGERRRKSTFTIAEWVKLSRSSVPLDVDALAALAETDINTPLSWETFLKLWSACEQKVSSIVLCARDDSFSVFEAMVRAGSDVNVSDNSGSGPLHWVIQDLDVSVEYPSFTAIMSNREVSRIERGKCVSRLIDLGVDLNDANAVGYTALHAAAMCGMSETCATLLEAGARANLVADDGNTPLHLICTSPSLSLSCVKALVHSSVGTSAKRSTKRGPCATSRCERVLRRLECAMDAAYKEALYPAYICESASTIMNVLCRANDKGHLPLHCACGGASPSRGTRSEGVSETELVQRLDVVDFLSEIMFSEDPTSTNAKSTDGKTALHMFSNLLRSSETSKAATSLVDVLLTRGVRVDAIDSSSQYSALHYALSNRNIALASHLLSYSDDVANDEKASCEAFYVACGLPVPKEMLTTLYRSKVRRDRTDCLLSAAAAGLVNNVDFLLRTLPNDGVDVNGKHNGATALHLVSRSSASSDDQAIIADALIQRGANVDAQDSCGETALFEAVRRGSSALVRYLLEKMPLSSLNMTNQDDASVRDICEEAYAASPDSFDHDVLCLVRKHCKTPEERETEENERIQRERELKAAKLINRMLRRKYAMRAADKRRMRSSSSDAPSKTRGDLDTKT